MANKKLNVYYHGLHVGTFAEMQYQLAQKRYSAIAGYLFLYFHIFLKSF